MMNSATASQSFEAGALRHLPYPVYWLNSSGAVTATNPAGEKLSAQLGLIRELPDAIRQRFDAIRDERAAEARPLTREVEVIFPAPHPTRWFVPEISPLGSEDTVTKSGWVVVLIDVTATHCADLARTRTLSALGHEVKTPVASMRMALHLLLEEKVGPLTADQRELVFAAREDCEGLLNLLQTLLELGQWEGRRIPLKLTAIRVADLLAQAESAQAEAARARGAALVLHSSETGKIFVSVDAVHISRALGDILMQVAKCCAAGQSARLSAMALSTERVRLSVNYQPKRPLPTGESESYFEPFYRRAGSGPIVSGVGLALAAEIVRAHGGQISISSGATGEEIRLDLPIAQE